MLLSGFTFIRNAKKYDFPVTECIESMLPIVDELVINVGKSEDDTEKLIATIRSPKIKIVNSVWDDSKTDRGLVLSEQTNIALDACQGKWALYLQADEAIHEAEHALIRKAVETASDEIDGYRFRYLHFYGGYSMIQRPWNWYPSEIRIIRRASGARSFGDAQTFRKNPDAAELKTELLPAHVFHYGHARSPETMTQKIRYFHRFWHGDEHGIQVKDAYKPNLKDMVWYWGTHPKVYAPRVLEGSTWSSNPTDVVRQAVGRPFKRVVIVYSGAETELALELKKLIELQYPKKIEIELVDTLRGWLRSALRSVFKTRLTSPSAVVDLRAETRGALEFLTWAMDAVFFFKWRIAHAPTGKVSRFRMPIYSVINWGNHQTKDEGFEVPASAQARQLTRWLGIP